MCRSLIKGCLYFFFILSEVCVCTYVFFFLQSKIFHRGEHCDLFNLAHIYLFYSYTDVKFTWGRSEMLLLPVPFELCICPYKFFFWLETWGGKKHTGYNELQLLICRQYFSQYLWLNQLYFSIFSLTEHWGVSVPLWVYSLCPRKVWTLSGWTAKPIGRWDLPDGCDCTLESTPKRWKDWGGIVLKGLAPVVTVLSLEAETLQAPNACIVLFSRTIPVCNLLKWPRNTPSFYGTCNQIFLLLKMYLTQLCKWM